ncbi:SAM-dependent methyltransferase [Candidatus Curtissbacteria bacterium]|nr:SAM-dependent methyltransferase [Candidatus Curtissbacteria bacterium]
METQNPALLEFLRRKHSHHPIPFHLLVEEALYNEQFGFYCGQEAGIKLFGAGNRPIDFSKLENRDQFMDYLVKLHETHPGAYKTPVEIYSPYFGIGLARYIEFLFVFGDLPPVIYEVGAGNGTLAYDLLDYLQSYQPDLFNRVTYSIVEKSDKLAAIQAERLARFGGKVAWRRGDARSLPFGNNSLEGVVVHSELLDNLPNACIRRKKQSHPVRLDDFVEIHYQFVDGRLVEKEAPLSVRVKNFISQRSSLLTPGEYAPSLDISPGENAYIGIGAADFYKELGRVLKNGFVVGFDYNSLGRDMEGSYTQMDIHTGDDYLDFLGNLGIADIYFSVDCWTLANIARSYGLQAIDLIKPQGAFFKDIFGGRDWERLCLGKDGYVAPILRSPSNTFCLINHKGVESDFNYFYVHQRQIVQRHIAQNEDLTLGRQTQP